MGMTMVSRLILVLAFFKPALGKINSRLR